MHGPDRWPQRRIERYNTASDGPATPATLNVAHAMLPVFERAPDIIRLRATPRSGR